MGKKQYNAPFVFQIINFPLYKYCHLVAIQPSGKNNETNKIKSRWNAILCQGSLRKAQNINTTCLSRNQDEYTCLGTETYSGESK